MIPNDAKKIVVELYDASDSETKDMDQDDVSLSQRSLDDEDKILYNKIGRTEMAIDKVLSNLLVVEEYATFRNIIASTNEEQGSDKDDIFSSHSMRNDANEFRNLVQTKGKLHLIFRAELSEDFVDRLDKIKVNYIKETHEKMEQLKASIDSKFTIIK